MTAQEELLLALARAALDDIERALTRGATPEQQRAYLKLMQHLVSRVAQLADPERRGVGRPRDPAIAYGAEIAQRLMDEHGATAAEAVAALGLPEEFFDKISTARKTLRRELKKGRARAVSDELLRRFAANLPHKHNLR